MIICLVTLLPAVGLGRVFWLRRSSGRDVLETTAGWRTVYNAAVQVNGRPGKLQVTACDDEAAIVAERLRTAWDDEGATVDFNAGNGIFTGIVRVDGEVRRLLLLEMPGVDSAVVLSLTQTEADYRNSLQLPPGKRLDGVPVYPGSIPQLLVRNDDTQASLEISTASGGVENVMAFFDKALPERGYHPLLPKSAGQSALRDFAVYQRRGMLFCVLARPGAGGQTTVTLLHKRHGMD